MAKRASKSDEATSGDVEAAGAETGTLEAAMQELSRIVTRLESGQETLDESLAAFERGMSLLRTCHKRLDAAAQRIELVTRLTPDGDVETEPFDADATFDGETVGTRKPRRSSASGPATTVSGTDTSSLFD